MNWVERAARHFTAPRYTRGWASLTEACRVERRRQALREFEAPASRPKAARELAVAGWIYAARALEADGTHKPEGAPSPTKVGVRIRSLRQEKGWSQSEFADAVNRSLSSGSIDRSTLGDIETGRIEKPSEPVLAAIAAALGVGKDSLIADAGGADETPDTART